MFVTVHHRSSNDVYRERKHTNLRLGAQKSTSSGTKQYRIALFHLRTQMYKKHMKILEYFFSCRQQGAHQNGPDASAHLLTSPGCACHMFSSGEFLIQIFHFEPMQVGV